jgi:hypothetical protein
MSTSIKGNVNYVKQVIEDDHATEDGGRRAKWETERTVIDAEEHERASKTRDKARGYVLSVCASTAFGHLCPESSSAELAEALRKARAVCDEFNATANVTRIFFNALAGRVAQDDVEAVRAINREVRELLKDMETGIQSFDVKTIRDAADRAKELGTMLTPDAQARITMAIEAARSMAKKIKAAGETAAVEIDRRTLTTLAEARTAFLDLDGGGDIAQPIAEGRALDLAPEAEALASVAKQPVALEID